LELFLAEDVRVLVAALPEGKDPFDVCREQGLEAFQGALGAAEDALEYKWALVRKEFGAAESPAAQRRALDAMLASLAQAPVLTGREPSVRRDLLLGRISKALGVEEASLRRELARHRRQAGRTAAGLEVGPNLPAGARGRRWVAERDLMTALVHWPTRAAAARQALGGAALEDPALGRLLEAIGEAQHPRDSDIENLVRGLDDPDLSALAIELCERGEAIQAGRRETDTGPGPLGRMLEEAVQAILELEKEKDLAARSEAVRQTGDDLAVRRAYAEARKAAEGYLPPAAKRRTTAGAGGPGTA
jgi:DNA primase